MKHLKKLLSALLVMVLLLSGLPVYAAETAETPDAAADYAIIQKTDFVFQWQGPIKRTHTLTAEYEPMSGVNSGISAPDQKAPRISGLFARNMVWKSDDGTVVLKPGDRFTYEQMKTLANADGVVHFSAGKRQ